MYESKANGTAREVRCESRGISTDRFLPMGEGVVLLSKGQGFPCETLGYPNDVAFADYRDPRYGDSM